MVKTQNCKTSYKFKRGNGDKKGVKCELHLRRVVGVSLELVWWSH